METPRIEMKPMAAEIEKSVPGEKKGYDTAAGRHGRAQQHNEGVAARF